MDFSSDFILEIYDPTLDGSAIFCCGSVLEVTSDFDYADARFPRAFPACVVNPESSGVEN